MAKRKALMTDAERFLEALQAADVETLREISEKLLQKARTKLLTKPVARVVTWPIHKKDNMGRYVLDSNGNKIVEKTYSGIEIVIAYVGKDGKIKERDYRLSSVPLLRALIDPDVQDTIRKFLAEASKDMVTGVP